MGLHIWLNTLIHVGLMFGSLVLTTLYSVLHSKSYRPTSHYFQLFSMVAD